MAKSSPDALVDAAEEITPSQANTAKVTAVAVSKLVRKTFVETVIPDIISLKILVSPLKLLPILYNIILDVII